MKTTISFLATLLAGGLVLAGCDKNGENRPATTANDEVAYAPGTTTPESAEVASPEMTPGAATETARATDQIAGARCAREQRCSNVGGDRKYSSMADCDARIRNDWRDDLNARECPGGVDQKELNECMTAIRDEDCSAPFDTLGRIAACTAVQICEDADDAEDRPLTGSR
jgi:hypothetical protein